MLSFIKKYSLVFIILAVAAFYLGKYLYMQPKVVNGENSPVIKGQLLDGSSFDLAELKGQYVLVDFWGSWCGPCLKEIPGLKQIDQKYKNKAFKEASGMKILSIAIEKNEARWKSAIKRTGMNWKYHMVDLSTSLKFLNSPLATEFGVKQVPSKFLLNPEGVIIGVNQSLEEIDAFFEERLK